MIEPGGGSVISKQNSHFSGKDKTEPSNSSELRNKPTQGWLARTPLLKKLRVARET